MATIKDEYWGHGGSYELDPKTGKRKLVERTQPAPHPQSEIATNGLSSDTPAPDSGED
jgi:hypothetical protein